MPTKEHGVGCENVLDNATVRSARTKGDASTALRNPIKRDVVYGAAKAANAVIEIDRRGDRAIVKARDGALQGVSPADRAAYGDVAESAVARHVVEKLGHDVIHLNTTPNEKGIDLVSYDSATKEIFVWEVKSSLIPRSINTAPSMRRTASGKQMSEPWLDERLAAAGLDVAAASEVEARAVKVDLTTGQAQIWVIDPATGAKAASEPVDIEDLLDLQY